MLIPSYIIAKQKLEMKRGWEKARERCESCAPEATSKLSAAWGSEWESHTLVFVVFLRNSQQKCVVLSTSWKYFHTVEFKTVIFCYTCKFHYDTRGRHKFECSQTHWSESITMSCLKRYKFVKTKESVPILVNTNTKTSQNWGTPHHF